MTATIKLTTAQALIRFLDNQYIEIDSNENKFVRGIIGIFGHGNVTGIGEALQTERHKLTFMQGHNEQGMVHTATAFAKQKNRLEIFACTSSIGPGAMNMLAGAATATANRIPVLLLPGEIFSSRQPDPVLQQIEIPTDYTNTSNDCFKPVCRYWDRLNRPEQLMTAALNAFRVLTDPENTGAVTLALPQDVQVESYDYPQEFFKKRVWHLDRKALSLRALSAAATLIKNAKKPLIIAGGGVHYSLAYSTLRTFAKTFGIPVAETEAGKSAMSWKDPLAVGGIGVTGTAAANLLLKDADLIFAIGTRLGDFTTKSKFEFGAKDSQIIHLNVSAFDGLKMDALLLQADAKSGLENLTRALKKLNYKTSQNYQSHVAKLQQAWNTEVDRLYTAKSKHGNCQTAIIGALNNFMDKEDIIVCAAGSLPGDLHRVWRVEIPKTYHMEYAWSTMGYEIAGGLGAKIAAPNKNVYVIVGDGSFIMLHSELLTSIQENQKITIILLDNHGYQCINNLQKSQGCEYYGNDFLTRENKSGLLNGAPLEISFVTLAQSLGAKSYFAKNITEFNQALVAAKKEKVTTLIEIKVDPRSMSNGYESWWRVGVAEVSPKAEVRAAHTEMQNKILKSRKY
ncbi:MAG: 3D-(3,5/4)-trihydroxycyclohexane-1,2-dione acylhydrolase (decyclizing) [Gammaproteobacteria bacterium]|nr:3D-(3,5/4)-trihydroxycyclohexane-1,2-dione acylhydrolase (decyclizing) [Gammaproteobacteria bacterium]